MTRSVSMHDKYCASFRQALVTAFAKGGVTAGPTEVGRGRFAGAWTAALGLAACLAGSAAHAHHAFAAEYDADQQGTLIGEVIEVRFINPHVRYLIRAEMDDGAGEEWELQTHNVRTMVRMGWTAETIQVGDRIEVSGALGRNGVRKLSMDSVVLADGTRFDPRGGEVADAYTTIEINADPDKSYGVVANSYPVDITGLWDNTYRFRLTVDDLKPKPTPFTPEGRAVHEANENWLDPSKSCRSGGLPRLFGSPTNMEILDVGDYYLITQANRPRRIWMDGRGAPPPGSSASPMGFSTGRWEGEVFVIETTHLEPGWLDGSGLPMSGEGTRIVETLTISEDRLSMERKMTIHDPYYTEPLVRIRGSARNDDLQFVLDPGCDARGYYRDLQQQGLLEALWEN